MNRAMATCPHADCDWQKTRKDGRVVCAFLSKATHPCAYRMIKNTNIEGLIQNGSSGYIVRTGSGVMKLGPRKFLWSPLYSGRVSERAFELLDDEIKRTNVRHGGPVTCGLVKRSKKNKIVRGSSM